MFGCRYGVDGKLDLVKVGFLLGWWDGESEGNESWVCKVVIIIMGYEI